MKTLHQEDFICSFENITDYPFDEQNCQLQIYVDDNKQTYLKKGILKTNGISLNIGQYTIIPTNHANECYQPSNQLCQVWYQVWADYHCEHHLHDGPCLCLSVSLCQPSSNSCYQASRDLAPLQPCLPIRCHHHQHHSSGKKMQGFNVYDILTFFSGKATKE